MCYLAIDYLHRTACTDPSKVAIVDGEHSIPFRELWRQSVLLADGLDRNCSSRIAVICIPKSIQTIIAIVASQLAGMIYVPLDPETPRDRLRRMTAKLGSHDFIEWGGEDWILNGAHCGDSAAESEIDVIEGRLMKRLREKDAAGPLYILFTSGSTGTPKGVAISNRSVTNYIDWVLDGFDVKPDDAIGNTVPLFFDGSVLDLYVSFATGCTLHLIPKRALRFPSDLVTYLFHHKIALALFVPSLLNTLAALDLLEEGGLPHLRKVFFIGEPMPLPTLRYLRARLPEAVLANHYGPTETTVASICWTAGQSLDGLPATPIGTPCANTVILLVDDENRVVDAPDVTGEIWIGGAGVALGYWNEAQATSRKFVQNPLHSRNRDTMYRTGDLAYKSSKDGQFYFVGRKDFQFKHLGHRIEPGEIEFAVEGLEGVGQCCVLFDDSNRRIVAFASVSRGREGRDLSVLLREAIPQYMIPHEWVFVERFPLTSNGKVDRRALRSGYEEAKRRELLANHEKGS